MSLGLITSIKPQNILLFNFYSLLLIQLIFNWSNTGCNNYANIWKLFYLFILYFRLI
jgi:hypothetical protein